MPFAFVIYGNKNETVHIYIIHDNSIYHHEGRVFPLRGQWEFYYGKLYAPDDFMNSRPLDKTLIELPSSWETRSYPELGCATYRLVIDIGGEQTLIMHVPEIISASVIWINGEKVFSVGQVAPEKKAHISYIRNDYAVFLTIDGVAEIIIQASNYDFPFDGLYYEIRVGTAHTLLQNVFRERILLAAVLGGILLIGLYHFILYLFRRRDKIYAIFGVICMLAVLRVASDTNAFVQYFLPSGMDMFSGHVYYLINIMHALSIVYFLLITFEIRLRLILNMVYGACYIVPVVAVLTLSLRDSTRLLYLFMIPFAITFCLAIRPARRTKSPYIILYLVSIAIYIVYGMLSYYYPIKTYLQSNFCR